jgi:hypothetical protein
LRETEYNYIKAEMRHIAEGRKQISEAEKRIALYLAHRIEKHRDSGGKKTEN